MELCITIHGESNIFVGNRPVDASQSLNRLELVTGIKSATRLVKGPRRQTPDFHRPDHGKSARELQHTRTKAVNLFRERYQSQDPDRPPAPGIHGPGLGTFLGSLSEDQLVAVSKTAYYQQQQVRQLAARSGAACTSLGPYNYWRC